MLEVKTGVLTVGAAQVPSALRKLVVPPPEAGARPAAPDVTVAVVARVPLVGRVTVVVAVAVKVTENAPDVIRELPFARVRVAHDAGAVIVILLIEVAVATPKVGVVKVGETSGALAARSVVRLVT